MFKKIVLAGIIAASLSSFSQAHAAGLAAPTLVSPTGNTFLSKALTPTEVSLTRPAFVWNEVPGAESYDIYIPGVATKNVLATACTTGKCTATSELLGLVFADGHNYTWYVRARTASATGPYSKYEPFSVAATANGLPGNVIGSPGYTPEGAWKLLLEGNARFVNEKAYNVNRMSTARVRTDAVTNKQRPYAVVLTCSDSRVSPELMFDKGLGEVFVVRVAGNIYGRHELGSIEYAVEHLGAKLIVVLGHSKCGAVQATFDIHNQIAASGGSLTTCQSTGTPDNICSLVDTIEPAVAAAIAHSPAADVEECVLENINLVKEHLLLDSPDVIEHAVSIGEVAIIKAKYDVTTGVVTEIP